MGDVEENEENLDKQAEVAYEAQWESGGPTMGKAYSVASRSMMARKKRKGKEKEKAKGPEGVIILGQVCNLCTMMNDTHQWDGKVSIHFILHKFELSAFC